MGPDGWLVVKPGLTKADLATLAAKWRKVQQEAAAIPAPPVTVKSVRPKLRYSVTAIPYGGRLVTIEESDSDSDSE